MLPNLELPFRHKLHVLFSDLELVTMYLVLNLRYAARLRSQICVVQALEHFFQICFMIYHLWPPFSPITSCDIVTKIETWRKQVRVKCLKCMRPKG